MMMIQHECENCNRIEEVEEHEYNHAEYVVVNLCKECYDKRNLIPCTCGDEEDEFYRLHNACFKCFML